MKRISQLFCLIFITGAFSLAVTAQNTMSPEKRKLIAEFIVVSKIDKQMEQLVDLLLKNNDTMYAASVKQMLERRTDLTQKQKDALEKEMVEKANAFGAKFRERLPAAVNYTEYVEQALYPLYDKAFTEKEMADLVAFYKSETGQKVLVAMPQLMAESMELTQKLLVPKVIKLVDDIIAEELAGAKPTPVKTN